MVLYVSCAFVNVMQNQKITTAIKKLKVPVINLKKIQITLKGSMKSSIILILSHMLDKLFFNRY